LEMAGPSECYFDAAFFVFAHRAFCAAEIFARAEADRTCFFGVVEDCLCGPRFVVVPANRALICCRREISASSSAMISFDCIRKVYRSLLANGCISGEED
jgi:hypothetical protein